jgi:hypothetical protein
MGRSRENNGEIGRNENNEINWAKGDNFWHNKVKVETFSIRGGKGDKFGINWQKLISGA